MRDKEAADSLDRVFSFIALIATINFSELAVFAEFITSLPGI
jgi:hypothetical protein